MLGLAAYRGQVCSAQGLAPHPILFSKEGGTLHHGKPCSERSSNSSVPHAAAGGG